MPATANSSKRDRAALYVDEIGNKLFVPAIAMWHVRKATRITDILQRAGVAKNRWITWQSRWGADDWRFDWMLRSPKIVLPKGLQIMYPSQVGHRKEAKDRYFPEPEMWAVRKQTSVKAIRRAVRVDFGGPELQSSIPVWRETWRELAGFEDWLFHRGSLDEVIVAQLHQIEACRLSWESYSLAAECGISAADYIDFFWEFPQDQIPAWASWLFGGAAPDGWYIPPEKVIAIRHRLSLRGIATATPISESTMYTRNRVESQRQALDEAIDLARKGKLERFEDCKTWRDLESKMSPGNAAQMKRRIIRCAQAATWSRVADDVGVSGGYVVNLLKEAERVAGTAARDALLKYVDCRHSASGRDIGVVADGLFVPSGMMRRFREELRKRKAKTHAARVKATIPKGLFDLWFLDAVLPSKFRNRLLHDDRNETRSKNCEPNPFDPIGDEPLTATQREVMAALEGRALQANNLQTQLEVGRHTVFDALKPLKDAGRLKYDRKIGGYYRPDSPPSV